MCSVFLRQRYFLCIFKFREPARAADTREFLCYIIGSRDYWHTKVHCVSRSKTCKLLCTFNMFLVTAVSLVEEGMVLVHIIY